MLKLELMSTEGCHLCDEAEAVLLLSLPATEVEIDWVDIAYDDALMDQFATRIPVLYCPATNHALDWPFAQEDVHAFLTSLSET
ncbi:glutaredoxin family protein [Nitrincola tibetensis]|uniref:Glutaredoxin family protein n=1 Tax=Nitrincola tibetensis TaxID=2219697 RepID=A0A364NL55_9GAMM|nr:glutaredoxin family protein [Nitrincola tibetensis]RAU17730.1 glutaredoxin family protein [Nitrincola tibetensis]